MTAVCDFCGETLDRSAWEYPCADFDALMLALDSHDNVADGGLHRFVGAWLACPPCHDLIDASDFDALARRATPALHTDDPRLLDALRQLHGAFREHRTGEPRRIMVQR